MRLFYRSLLVFMACWQSIVSAQTDSKFYEWQSASANQTDVGCSKLKSDWKKHQFKTQVASLAEEDYDVKHVQLYLILDNQSNDVNGHVVTTAEVVVDSMHEYVFELSHLLQVDSLFINQQLVASSNITTNGDVITVKLHATLMQAETF